MARPEVMGPICSVRAFCCQKARSPAAARPSMQCSPTEPASAARSRTRSAAATPCRTASASSTRRERSPRRPSIATATMTSMATATITSVATTTTIDGSPQRPVACKAVEVPLTPTRASARLLRRAGAGFADPKTLTGLVRGSRRSAAERFQLDDPDFAAVGQDPVDQAPALHVDLEQRFLHRAPEGARPGNGAHDVGDLLDGAADLLPRSVRDRSQIDLEMDGIRHAPTHCPRNSPETTK